jgi:hypothetical protein
MYFTNLQQIEIKDAVTRNRFVFADRKGKSHLPFGSSFSLGFSGGFSGGLTIATNTINPLGIYQWTNNPTEEVGIAQYFSLSCGIAVLLELGEAVSTDNKLTYDAIGRGIKTPAGRITYAIALQSGSIGDWINVIVGRWEH